jgi:hypothetical protein
LDDAQNKSIKNGGCGTTVRKNVQILESAELCGISPDGNAEKLAHRYSRDSPDQMESRICPGMQSNGGDAAETSEPDAYDAETPVLLGPVIAGR